MTRPASVDRRETTMKSILVHVDASPRSAERVKLALSLARRHGAELTAYYGVLPAMVSMPWAAAETLDANVGKLIDEGDRRQRDRARAEVMRLANDATVRWVDGDEAGGRRMPLHLARMALLTDLLVLGQFDPGDRDAGAVPPDLVSTAVVDGGKPTLVVPSAGTFDASPGSVLIAWKSTRESARATAAALPWLEAAREIHVALGNEDDQPASMHALEHWLRLHGVGGSIEGHGMPARGDIEVGEALLSLAADVSAGLLAMGCYGHSRAREWVLGGVTRTILRSMTVPTLLAH